MSLQSQIEGNYKMRSGYIVDDNVFLKSQWQRKILIERNVKKKFFVEIFFGKDFRDFNQPGPAIAF